MCVVQIRLSAYMYTCKLQSAIIHNLIARECANLGGVFCMLLKPPNCRAVRHYLNRRSWTSPQREKWTGRDNVGSSYFMNVCKNNAVVGPCGPILRLHGASAHTKLLVIPFL